MKKLKGIIIAFAFAGMVIAPLALASDTLAINPLENVCTTGSTSEICGNSDEDIGSFMGIVVNTMLFIVGLLSVIMIIVSGILYTTSGGDSGKVSRAKNTLTYSIVGLVVAFIAYALVNWVLQLL